MNREQLSAALRTERPESGDLVSIERRGETYGFARTRAGDRPSAAEWEGGFLPDAWISYSGEWPFEDAGRWEAFFEDLLAEMEAMSGGADRCRWPADEPWPHGH